MMKILKTAMTAAAATTAKVGGLFFFTFISMLVCLCLCGEGLCEVVVSRIVFRMFSEKELNILNRTSSSNSDDRLKCVCEYSNLMLLC